MGDVVYPFGKVLTHNAEDGGTPVGYGFYHKDPGNRRYGATLVKRFPNGWVRRVWIGWNGAAVMTAWLRNGTWDA